MTWKQASNESSLGMLIGYLFTLRRNQGRHEWALARVADPDDALIEDACKWLRLRWSTGEYKGSVVKSEVRAALIEAARGHTSWATPAGKGIQCGAP